jgi:hypothetical protein
MMLLTLLVSRKMIFGENLAQVADSGIEGCVVGTGAGRCAWEAVYSADSLRTALLCGLHLVDIGFGAWQRLGSRFGGGDEWISGGFEEDE